MIAEAMLKSLAASDRHYQYFEKILFHVPASSETSFAVSASEPGNKLAWPAFVGGLALLRWAVTGDFFRRDS